jgi:hypothetical protein
MLLCLNKKNEPYLPLPFSPVDTPLSHSIATPLPLHSKASMEGPLVGAHVLRLHAAPSRGSSPMPSSLSLSLPTIRTGTIRMEGLGHHILDDVGIRLVVSVAN